MRGGRLSFGFIGDLFPEPVDYVPDTTFEAFAKAHGIPMELIQHVHERLALPRPDPNDPIRTDEAEYLPLAAMSLAAGLSDAGLSRFSRVMGENLRRLAEAQVNFFTSEVTERISARDWRRLLPGSGPPRWGARCARSSSTS
jgi:hypothetical protein